MEGIKTPIKPFTKTLGKRKLKDPVTNVHTNSVLPSKNDIGLNDINTGATATNTVTDSNAEDEGEDDDNDDNNNKVHTESYENIKELKETPSVSLTTILRWKEKKRVDVDCFLGFSDHSSEADKIAGTEILHTIGHFYCVWCQCYIRANKKSAQRHQTRNKKHLSKANDELGVHGVNNINEIIGTNTISSHHPSLLLSQYNSINESESIYDPSIHHQQHHHQPSSSQSSILSHAYLAATKNSDLNINTATNGNTISSPAPEAWTIISNPKKVQDSDKLSDILTSLGICDSHDLMLCEPNEIIDIISTLKPVGQRRMKQLYHMLLTNDANSSNAASNTASNSSSSHNSHNNDDGENRGEVSAVVNSNLLLSPANRQVSVTSQNHSRSSNNNNSNQSLQSPPQQQQLLAPTTTATTTTPHNNHHHHGTIRTPNGSVNTHQNTSLPSTSQFSSPTTATATSTTATTTATDHATASASSAISEYPLSSSSSST